MANLERPGRHGMYGVKAPWTVRVGAGLVTVVALAAAILPARTMILVDRGRADLDRGDSASAEGKFTAAEKLATIDKWIAPYDAGVARYTRGNYDGAASKFEKAAGLAPDEEQCRVRLNWAWSLEASADRYATADNRDEALVRWRQGKAVLTDTQCTSSSQQTAVRSTRSRLDRKRQNGGAGNAGEEADSSGQQNKEDELEQKLKKAQEQRQKALDQANTSQKDAGSGTGRTW
ncbi:tetratricopeptide repeat protein [Cutibacterium sp.]|uniref:tetratricopeptide repeat protein n=1 Tax=Cutibacterium sp. TaxID=1912221 RepID=UPI0026DA79FE|nr:tetratricopeptide repeat protein [Cutibacterium sp.]MDO4413101.1 tetratricopeptide repeat protein [Cutibacterium sp.]